MKEENPSTIISLSIYGKTVSVEIPYSDVDAHELLDAFSGMMITHTFLPCTVYKAMIEKGEELLEYGSSREDVLNENRE